MDINAIQQIIGSLGFPIACSIGLFWLLYKTEASHKQEMTAMKEAINELRTAIIQLTALINQKTD